MSRCPTSATASPTLADARDERVAEALDRDARQRAAARLDEVGERGLLAGHAGDGDELEREPREGLGVGRQRISSSRRSALRSGPSAPASSMTPGILRAQVSCLRAYCPVRSVISAAHSASVAAPSRWAPICARPRMRGRGRRRLDSALAQRAHLLDRAAGEHRLGARRDARAQLGARPRRRPRRAAGRRMPAAPQAVVARGARLAPCSASSSARTTRRRSFACSRSAARGSRRASSASARRAAALVVERAPSARARRPARPAAAPGRSARRAGRGPCRRRRAASRPRSAIASMAACAQRRVSADRARLGQRQIADEVVRHRGALGRRSAGW